jgi:hypothetical protein
MANRALAAGALALCVASLALPPPAHAGPPPPTYVPPVDAPVVDPFRPPPHPYAPGNRGLEYGTAPGTEVRAAADGTVTFAGVVAGTRHVTVRHGDDVRTSYSFLDRVDVAVGQRVRLGDVVGTTAGRLHLGARRGDAYFDPASLFAGGPTRVRLVPFDEPPGAGAGGERSALHQLVGGLGGVLGRLAEETADRALAGTGASVDWLRAEGGQLLRTAGHLLARGSPTSQLHLLTTVAGAWQRARAAADRPCTAAGAPLPAAPPHHRVALLVGGLGSTSTDAAIDDVDTGVLGYAAPHVVRFSYAGGRVPDPTDAAAGVPAAAYSAADSQIDLLESGRRLADLVEALVAAHPGLPVDLYAHSQGGLVARLALIDLERRHGTAWLDHVGLLATLGTPHDGADLATAVHGIGSTGAGSAAFDALAVALGLELDDDAPSVQQLAETSSVVGELRRRPIPASIAAVSIAARGDLVVPVPRTAVDGAAHVVVPVDGLHGHDALPGSPEATRELSLALAGLPPTCRSFRGALVDQITGEAISWAEDGLGAGGWVAALRFGKVPLGG